MEEGCCHVVLVGITAYGVRSLGSFIGMLVPFENPLFPGLLFAPFQVSHDEPIRPVAYDLLG